jgi:hypothetical protein
MAEHLNAKRTAIRFFEAWKHQHWPICLSYVQITWKRRSDNRRGFINRLKRLMGGGENALELLTRRLETRRIADIRDVRTVPSPGTSQAVEDVVVSVKYDDGRLGKLRVRLVCEKGPYRADAGGTWGVNPNSIKPV